MTLAFRYNVEPARQNL